MRRSRKQESNSAKELTRLLEEILDVAPAKAAKTIEIRHGFRLGEPGTRFGPKVSQLDGCIPCTGTMIMHKAHIVRDQNGRPMIATIIEWPANHAGLFVLRSPRLFIEDIMLEHGVVRLEPRAQLTAELIATFEQQLNELRA